MKRQISLLMILMMLGLTACETTLNEPATGALIGGGAGAGLGAIIGNQSGHAGAGTAIGLALQHRRHGRPGPCTVTCGRRAASGNNLVHPHIFRAGTFGDTCHGLRSPGVSCTADVSQ